MIRNKRRDVIVGMEPNKKSRTRVCLEAFLLSPCGISLIIFISLVIFGFFIYCWSMGNLWLLENNWLPNMKKTLEWSDGLFWIFLQLGTLSIFIIILYNIFFIYYEVSNNLEQFQNQEEKPYSIYWACFYSFITSNGLMFFLKMIGMILGFGLFVIYLMKGIELNLWLWNIKTHDFAFLALFIETTLIISVPLLLYHTYQEVSHTLENYDLDV